MECLLITGKEIFKRHFSCVFINDQGEFSLCSFLYFSWPWQNNGKLKIFFLLLCIVIIHSDRYAFCLFFSKGVFSFFTSDPQWISSIHILPYGAIIEVFLLHFVFKDVIFCPDSLVKFESYGVL